MKSFMLGSMLILGACAELPWDPAGTLDRVQQSGVLRAGMISDAGATTARKEAEFIGLVAQVTGSTPQISSGSAEKLLPRLERGELDLVIGQFPADTPWKTRVTLMPSGKDANASEPEMDYAAAVRNGENAWIELISRHAPVLKEGML